MKNIETILSDLGIELTDEQKTKLKDEHNKNYKTINEYEKQTEKITTLEKTVKDTEKALNDTKDELKKFDGIDTDGLNKKIAELEQTIKDNETDYLNKISERDFNDLIEKAITSAKGKNAKAIKSLLDMDALKESKNQLNDLDAQLKELAKAEDSKMLFGDPEPEYQGSGNPIGRIKKDGSDNNDVTMHDALASYYS